MSAAEVGGGEQSVEIAQVVNPLADLTDDEAADVDRFMGEHMYRHSISNSYNAFACNLRCRTEALAEAFRTCVLVPRRAERGQGCDTEAGK